MLWKFQTSENFNKLHLIIHHTFTFKTLWICIKKCTAKPYFFLVIYATLASDKFLSFRKNVVEKIQKLIMIIGDKIRYEKLQYNINRKAAKISTLSSGKNDKCEYLKGTKILPSDQSRIIEQAKFIYSRVNNLKL